MKPQALKENHEEDKNICKTQGKENKTYLQYFLAYLNRI